MLGSLKQEWGKLKPTIICVDDERLVLASLKEQLARHFGSAVRVEVAESGQDALELVDELMECGEFIPLIISDHLMPGIKGDELLAQVHTRLPETLTIMLTGEASAGAVGSAVNTAALYRFIGKPWGHDDLMLTVREALVSYEQTRKLAEQSKLLSQLHEVALDLAANLAAHDRYSRLLASAAQMFPADAVYIHRVRDGRLQLLASTNPDARDAVGLALYPELTTDAAVFRAKGPAAREAQLIYAETALGHDSHLRVGLVGDDGPFGLVSLFGTARDVFAEISDERILGFAALVGASVRTTELVDHIEELSQQRLAVAQHLHRAAAERVDGPLQGTSPAVTALRDHLNAVADTGHAVLLIAQSGAGSEVSARAIHDSGPHRDGPFIVLRSTGMDDTDEVFADAPSGDGMLDLAAGGTLFVDRVDRLSLSAQAGLAEFIAHSPNARVIAAVHRPLTDMIRLGEFDVVLARALNHEIEVPALRQRVPDIETLAHYYLRQHAARLGKSASQLSETSVKALQAYKWPGNIRELSNIMERAAMTASGTMVEVDPSLLEGATTLGAYRLIERIGRGGMGEVWRAKHHHLTRPAAVKLIRSDEGQVDKRTVQRFRREAEATARLRSPHTVQLYDFGVSDDGAFYYVMELLDGLDLDTLVDKHGPLEPARAVAFLLQLCRSLGEAHAIGLVHRDIKPANLFACQLGGEYDFLKVLDFGMVTSGDGTKSELTTGSAVYGTPSYIAPEVILQQEVDGRADIYCLGLVAHFLLSGRTVYGKAPAVELFLHHVRTPARPTSEVATWPISPELDRLILDCLAKDPTDRPANVDVVAQRLTELTFDVRWDYARAKRWWSELLGPPTDKAAVDPSTIELLGDAHE